MENIKIRRSSLSCFFFSVLIFFVIYCTECTADSSEASSFPQSAPRGFAFFRGSLVHGLVDDCTCTAESVDQENEERVHDLLDELVHTRYFSTAKVDLTSECPFWAQQFMCGLGGGCSVCECDDDEIPLPWRQQERTALVDRRQPLQNVKSWADRGVADAWFEHRVPEMTYVNLLMNPEANTGYKGEEPRRVWAAIHENCPRGLLSELCLEERILRRLMSGFHLSVTTHVASYFHHNQSEHALRVREVLRRYRTALESKTLFEDLHPRFQPNLDMFESVIRSHPDRIQDLSVYLARNALVSTHYDTGDMQADLYTHKLIERVLQQPLVCNPTFNDSLLQISSSSNMEIRQRLSSRFRNISIVMDCVGCEKCRVWSKIQTLGLATALKIVMLHASNSPIETLERNEIIALLNTLRQFSDSIENIKRMEQEIWRQRIADVAGTFGMILVGSIIVWCVISRCWRCRKSVTSAGSSGDGNSFRRDGDAVEESIKTNGIMDAASFADGLDQSHDFQVRKRKPNLEL